MEIQVTGRTAGGAPVCPEIDFKDLRGAARRLCRHSRTQGLEDDLVQAGALGLIEAKARYAPERGVPFGAFVRRRVEGAMLDEIRAHMPLSRRAWQRGLSLPMVATETDEVLSTPEDLVIAAHGLVALRRAIQALAEEEQAIVFAVYDFDESGDSGAAHARRSDLSKAWVSRRHLRVLDRLRAILRAGHPHG